MQSIATALQSRPASRHPPAEAGMRERWLGWCLLAYPKATRERDGDYLLDLALELGERSGVRRQALSLLRGGLLERARGVRRRAVLVVGAAVATLLVAAGVAVADVSVEVEVETTAAEADPASAPIDRFVDRTVPDGASGTLVAMRGRRRRVLRGLRPRRPRGPGRGELRHRLRHRLADQAVHRRSRGQARDARPARRARPDQRLARAGAAGQGRDHGPAAAHAHRGAGRLARRRLPAADPSTAGHARLSPPRCAPRPARRTTTPTSATACWRSSSSGRPAPATSSSSPASLFRPAHMTQTGYTLPHWRRSDVAVEYDARGRPQGRPMDHPWAATGPWWNLRGNGGMLSTARDLARWHRALLDHRVLDRRAQRELFRPRVPEQPSGESWYGYGWVLLDTAVGPVAWHNGGNGWSYAELTRVLGVALMVFWVTNQVRSTAGGWNLERSGQPPHRRCGPPAGRLPSPARRRGRRCRRATRRTRGSSSRPARRGRRSGGAARPRTPRGCRGRRGCRPSRRSTRSIIAMTSPVLRQRVELGLEVAPALDVEDRAVRRRGAVERQQPAHAQRRGGQLLRRPAHGHDRLREDGERRRVGAAGQPLLDRGQGALADVPVAVERHHQQPVGDLGRRPRHHRTEGAEQHRRRPPLERARDERRRHQRVPGVLAAEVEPGAVLPRAEDRLHRQHDLAHPGGGRATTSRRTGSRCAAGSATRARAGTGRRSSAAGRARCARGASASAASRSRRWSSGRSRRRPPRPRRAAGTRRAAPRR